MKIVSIVVFLFGIVSLGWAVEFKLDGHDGIFDECIKELEIGEDTEAMIKAHEFEKIDDPAAKCFRKCFVEKAHFINAAGQSVPEEIAKAYPDADFDQLKEIVESCERESGDDICDSVHLHTACVDKALKAL